MRACAVARSSEGRGCATLGNRERRERRAASRFELLGAGLRGARLNVEINLDSVERSAATPRTFATRSRALVALTAGVSESDANSRSQRTPGEDRAHRIRPSYDQ